MKRGRKSAAELSVVPVAGRIGKPLPPEDLTEGQADEWRAVVGSLPSGWVRREHYGILAAYCRHACRHQFLSQALDQYELEWINVEGGPERYAKLAAAAAKESAGMIACARQLRMMQQHQMHARTAGRRVADEPAGPRPWDAMRAGARA
jgi:hypothetical protein